jgi:hypothetical protein
MKGFLLTTLRRRDLLRVAITGTAVAAIETLAFEADATEPTGSADKRKSALSRELG